MTKNFNDSAKGSATSSKYMERLVNRTGTRKGIERLAMPGHPPIALGSMMFAKLPPDLVLCWDLSRRGDVRAALAEGLRVDRLATECGDHDLSAFASILVAWCCFQAGEIETGIENAHAAKRYWQEKGDGAREALANAIYAWLLSEGGMIEQAADEAVKALALAEQSGDRIALCWAQNVLGVIFWICKQLERALVLCQRAVGMARSSGDRVILGWWLINEAGVHSEIGYRRQAQGDRNAPDSLRRALSINDEAWGIAKEVGDDWGLRLTICNAAEYFIALGELTSAERALQACEALPGDCGNRSMAHYFYTKSQLLLKLGKPSEALSISTQALTLAQEQRNAEYETHALQYLSDSHEALGQFEAAFRYLKRFNAAQARLVAEKIQRRARLAEIQYETERFKQMAEEASQRAEQMTLTSRLDPLTGIGNRRQLEQIMSEIRAARADFAVAILDLDHFKGINDRFSHMVGDEVLKRVADVLCSAVRSSDSAMRFGGEEFVVIMRDTDLLTAMARCDDLRMAVAETGWGEIAPGLRVTASIGVAVWDHAGDPASILVLADDRLYAAKASGRNRVVGESPGITFIGKNAADARTFELPRITVPPGTIHGMGAQTAQLNLV